MSADIEIIETYEALCHTCGWSGEGHSYIGGALSEGDAHTCPAEQEESK